MVQNSIPEHNKRLHDRLDLLRRGTSSDCLFTKGCTEQVIQAHSVSRSILAKLQDNGQVMRPRTRTERDEVGRSRLHLGFIPDGILRASTGTFVCRKHDDEFKPVDTTPMDFDNPHIRNLLFYRAVIREVWQLLRTQRATIPLERSQLVPGPLPNHPSYRLRALNDLIQRIKPCINTTVGPSSPCPVVHLVRRVKTDRPIITGSCAGGGSIIGFDEETGYEFSRNDVHEVTGLEPNSCWGFTVVPQANEHMVLASWVKGSSAEDYFKHFAEVNGEELEEAVSAELIYFCENWFLHPKVWASYNNAKQNAIVSAFDNITELQIGKYQWRQRGKTQKWYDFLSLVNRRQINLFRYNHSIFASYFV